MVFYDYVLFAGRKLVPLMTRCRMPWPSASKQGSGRELPSMRKCAPPSARRYKSPLGELSQRAHHPAHYAGPFERGCTDVRYRRTFLVAAHTAKVSLLNPQPALSPGGGNRSI